MATRLLWGIYLLDFFLENMLQIMRFSVYFKIILNTNFLFAYKNNDHII